MHWAIKILRETALFIACAIFMAIVGLIVMDQFVMPRFVRQSVQITVPDLVGLTQAQARARLAGQGLRFSEEAARWDAQVPAGHIVLQNPPAGFKVKPNRTVYVVPSLGVRLFAVPDVQNRTLRQARLWIEQTGLAVGDITEEASEEVREDHVIRQSPQPGTEVDAGTRIQLVVSSGPLREFVEMPNVVEMKLDDVRQLLISLSLRIDNIRYEFSTAYDPDVVIGQEPPSGASIRTGTRVRLVVSKL